MSYEQCNGVALYYEDEGEGRPVVYLHGVLAGLRFFQHQLSPSVDHRAVALDYRGHGRSETPETGHTVPQYARDLRAFLDRRDLDDVVLVGWSMGALVAWEYADQFGTDRLAGTVVVDMSASAFRWDDYDHGSVDLDGLQERLELVQTDPADFTERLIDAAFAGSVSPQTRRLARDELSRPSPPVKSAILADYTLRDYRDVLSALDVPALVVATADETWRTVAAVEHVASLLPDADVETFENSGHCPFLEEPVAFNRLVEEFVASL